MTWLWHRHDRPRDLPQALFTHLVVNMGIESDELGRLKMVSRPDYRQGKVIRLIRIYDPERRPSPVVTDFTSLDGHAESVVFEGWEDVGSGAFSIQSR